MRRGLPWILLALLGAAIWLAGMPPTPAPTSMHGERPVVMEGMLPQADAAQTMPHSTQRPGPQPPGFLPPEAIDVIVLIRQGGPFPYRQDGSVFGNREGRLPRQPRGWYREYTVDTPGVGHRGSRRIVTGGTPPTRWYYTDDHYDSFRRFEPGGTGR